MTCGHRAGGLVMPAPFLVGIIAPTWPLAVLCTHRTLAIHSRLLPPPTRGQSCSRIVAAGSGLSFPGVLSQGASGGHRLVLTSRQREQ